ncbi:hypothetical protein [Streptomyces mirabilis]|jgi:hypothetical protein|uniref:Uncharacterized protein n=1 Tax=Streptomyces mirabilis TaxID=68239 RepID=A0A1I2S5K8_9ACTN|nr:hypothetical protein [Streptomyces mirabilis]SFG48040.1 hypothetical protein SAMN02787118_121117 [Streptomyces mirabilis]
MTTGRARLTKARDDDGAEVIRFTAAGQEIDFAPATASLLRPLLEGGWWTLADLVTAATLSVPDAAGVVGELVDGQAAYVRAGDRRAGARHVPATGRGHRGPVRRRLRNYVATATRAKPAWSSTSTARSSSG